MLAPSTGVVTSGLPPSVTTEPPAPQASLTIDPFPTVRLMNPPTHVAFQVALCDDDDDCDALPVPERVCVRDCDCERVAEREPVGDAVLDAVNDAVAVPVPVGACVAVMDAVPLPVRVRVRDCVDV
jgi:hypothetical protein